MKTLVITSYVETSSKVKVTLLDPYTMEKGIFIQYKQYNPHCKDIIAECNRTNIALMPVDTWNRCIVNARDADEQLGAALAIDHYEQYKDKPEELAKYYKDMDKAFGI